MSGEMERRTGTAIGRFSDSSLRCTKVQGCMYVCMCVCVCVCVCTCICMCVSIVSNYHNNVITVTMYVYRGRRQKKYSHTSS